MLKYLLIMQSFKSKFCFSGMWQRNCFTRNTRILLSNRKDRHSYS